MGNRLITLEQAADGIWETAIKWVKEQCPDEPGQVEELNPRQAEMLARGLNGLGEYMFRAKMG